MTKNTEQRLREATPIRRINMVRNPTDPTLGVLLLQTDNDDFVALASQKSLKELSASLLERADQIEPFA
jgi:hypothetical protein